MSAIELKNICKTYQMDKVEVKAVDNATFSIEKGEFAAISGPSGSGKSTLLNIIGLVDLPSSGSVILDGKDVYASVNLAKCAKTPLSLDSMLTHMRRTHLGFIFQTFNLIPVLNVKENIELPLKLGKSPAADSMNKKERDEWIDFLLETVGLTDWKKHKPSELSGGQRQRVARQQKRRANLGVDEEVKRGFENDFRIFHPRPEDCEYVKSRYPYS